MPKRSFDWDQSSEQLCLSRSAIYEPQLKNKISERVLLASSSSDKARQEKKQIQKKTINMLFNAQKNKKEITTEDLKSPEPVYKPLSGLRSICSYFPHSSRLSDNVVNSGIAAGDTNLIESTTEEMESLETRHYPMSGLRSICSFFPQSSRLSDSVVNSRLEAGSTNTTLSLPQ